MSLVRRVSVAFLVALALALGGFSACLYYRWLASRLKGFEKADPKQLFRRFIETAGTVTVHPNRLIVAFDRRSHNPILREAALGNDSLRIAWLGQREIEFTYQ